MTNPDEAQGHMRKWKFDRHCDCVVALSAAGPRLTVGLSMLEGNIWDGCVKLIEEESGLELQSYGTRCGVSALCSLNGESVLAVGGDDGRIEILSSDSLQVLASWNAHDNIVSRLAAHKGDNQPQCVSAGWDGGLSVWDLNNTQVGGNKIPLRCYPSAHNGVATDCALSSLEPSIVATTGQDGFLRLWDMRQDQSGCCAIVNLGGPAACACFDDRDQQYTLAAGLDDGCAMLVDVRAACAAGSAGSLVRLGLHKARVRRLLPLDDARNQWLSASDDTTVRQSLLAPPPSEASAAPVSCQLLRCSDYVADLALCNGAFYAASTDKTLTKAFQSSTLI
jgi:WD40 repeat protein